MSGRGQGGNSMPRRMRSVFIRRESEVKAMSWNDRLWKRVLRVFGATEESSDNQPSNKVQYRLEKSRGSESVIRRLLCLQSRRSRQRLGINPNQKLATYLHWMFRTNFLVIFLVMCAAFFGLVIFFSGLITIAGTVDEQCVVIGGEPFNHAGTGFADAFALSWTSLSTVGYGSTAPALAYQNSNRSNCFFINLVCSLEALVGVLYSGFCGAILFGKVLRIQSHAQVIFSDPIVIRYGSGIKEAKEFTSKNENQDDEEQNESPCPVLEFRIANRLFGEAGGEIMDATLNVVANVDANDADPKSLDSLDIRRPVREESSGSADASSDYGSTIESSVPSSTSEGSLGAVLHKFIDPLMSLKGKRQQHTIDEDPSARLINKQIFSKLNIEASDHPFFKRVWLARHVLDEHSPLLKSKVRARIRRRNGSWPANLNTYQAIRDSLQFNQILVSMNGVSNVSASDVYAQKIYAFVDINIGYQFVNLLYKDFDGSLGVDLDLINDVKEQNGGGGEPLVVAE